MADRKVVKLTIPGAPFGKQRPKFTSRGKFGKAVTPEKTVNYETFVKLLYNEKYGKLSFEADEPLKITIRAYMQIPSSKSNKQKELMRQGVLRPTKRPDWDNIGKIIGDALNAIAYPDDKQIVESHIVKFFDENPRVEIEIENIDPPQVAA